MRWAIAAAISVFGICGAVAQTPEAVFVEGVRGLSGIWKISVPESVGINPFHDARFGAMKDMFCRIEQTGTNLDIQCLTDGILRNGSGTIAGEKIHLASGSALARLVIDGTVDREATWSGVFAAKLAGIRYDDNVPATGERLEQPIATPDVAGKAAILAMILSELGGGTLAVPHDADEIARNGGLPDSFDSLRALGAVQAITYLGHADNIVYLGHADKLGYRREANFFSVYAVEFDSGERICALHQKDDGVLDAFKCV